ncbi:MAG TPA: glycoside hydrolase family 66 protein [Candidatus Limiplasma sp.]|nr:glycoside hydrolase family 66 protein [Candidatus Limiplasma sp.]
MTELLTLKGKYRAGEPAELLLRHTGESADAVEVSVWHLTRVVCRLTLPLTGTETRLTLPAPEREGACYGVEAALTQNGRRVAIAASAVNTGSAVVRYGFLCDFLPEGDADVASLAAYHIDHVQFYDWSWRHDSLVSPTDEYTDMMGKRNSLTAIRAKIDACHSRGMLAMAYGAVYAASRPFYQEHPDWGLYAGSGRPMVFIDTFYYMDLESPWRKHLLSQYVQAVERVGFDGVHMDTYGEPKRALNAAGEPLRLEGSLRTLIGDADAALRKAGHTPHLIFNNVGAWPVEATRDQPQDAVYMELWPPMDRLRHLRDAVELARPAGKPVVLAAYPVPFRCDTPERALAGELIASFAIALCGATQLFLGEANAVTTQGYYADYTPLAPWQAVSLRAYQDFFVRYQELLFDPELRDVSHTHCKADNREYDCDAPYSVDGEAGKLWLTFREAEDRRLIGLINLCGCENDGWNLGKEKPIVAENITVRILLLAPVERVWYATPDDGVGTPVALPCECRETGLGTEATVVIPRLEICGLLWL